MTVRNISFRAGCLVGGLLGASTAVAGNGGMIVHVPYAQQVPTVGGFALVALALLLATLAFRLVRRPGTGGSRFLMLAITIGAVATGGSGIKLIGDAAATISDLEMTSASGGTVIVPDFETCYPVNNVSGTTQRIINIEAYPGWALGPCDANGGGHSNGGSFVGTCSDSPGTVLKPGQHCEIYASTEVET
ncbi:MAG: midcut-by-XrtH protein [Chromatiales bacterium]|nr:midcut-by-XrtH protein [Chromatiales bacterium]